MNLDFKQLLKDQLSNYEKTLFMILLVINLAMFGVRFISLTVLGDSSNLLMQFASSVLSIIVSLLNGLAWFYFLDAVRAKQVSFKSIKVQPNQILYLVLCAFLMEFLIIFLTFGSAFVTLLIPFVGAYLLLLITPFISIFALAMNGFIAFQIYDGEFKIVELFKNAFKLIKDNVAICLNAIIPYYLFTILFSLVASQIYVFLFTEINSFFSALAAFGAGEIGVTSLIIPFVLELASILVMVYLLVRVYLKLANIYNLTYINLANLKR